MARDYYETLGIPRTATADEIKKAHRKLVKETHPDRNPGDKAAEARFKEVQEAFDVLDDPKKRARYDKYGTAEGPPEGFAPGGFGGFQQGTPVDPSQIEDILGQFGGLGGLGDLFGGAGRGRRNGRGRRAAVPEPSEHELHVPFETAANGGTMSLSINDRQVDVKIPPGVEEGQTLRLQGQGPGRSDIHLKIRIEPHAFFKREGNDVVVVAPITIAEAVLGGKIDVPTLTGSKLTVKVPPGASSGARLRLRGKGIKGGDEYVELKIVTPPKIDDASRKLIEDFANANPHNPRVGSPWE